MHYGPKIATFDRSLILKIGDHRCDRLVELSEMDIQQSSIRRSDRQEISKEAGGTHDLSNE